MANNNFIVQSVKLHEFSKNPLWLNIVHHKQWYKYSFDITRTFTYTRNRKKNTALDAPI